MEEKETKRKSISDLRNFYAQKIKEQEQPSNRQNIEHQRISMTQANTTNADTEPEDDVMQTPPKGHDQRDEENVPEQAESEDETNPVFSQTHVECDGCDEEGRHVHWYCLTCKASLCDKCKSTKVHRSHTIKPWKDPDAIIARQNAPVCCGTHNGEMVVTFCSTCQILCCVLCVSNGHVEHRFSTIDETYNKKYEELNATLKMLQENFLPKTECKIDKIEQMVHGNEKKKTENLEKIRRRTEALKYCLESFEKDLHEKETTSFNVYMEPLNQTLQDTIMEKQQIKQLITEISKQLESPNKSCLIADSKRLSDVKRLRPIPLSTNRQDYPVFEISNFEFPGADMCIGLYRNDENIYNYASSSDFKLERKLASDSLREIWNGKWRKTTNVTIWRKLRRTNKGTDGEKVMDILRECKHENIVQLLTTFIHDDLLHFVIEKKSRAVLKDYLRENSQMDIDYRQLIDFAYQIARGMSYLENRDIVHRNLLAQCILISDELTLKIGGISQVCVSDKIEIPQGGLIIPVKWIAPEAALDGQFSIKSDVWSFGIVLVEIVTSGNAPYPGIGNKEVLERIKQGYRHPKPAKCDGALYETMLSCWDSKPFKRPTFEFLSAFFENYEVSVERKYDEIND